MTIALLDGDILAFRAAIVGQEENAFLTGGFTLNRQKAFDAANALIREWTSNADGSAPVVVFSGSNIWRYKILPTYKHNRKGTEKPALYADVLDMIAKHYKVLRYPGLEADDTMGILGTSDPRRYVIVSADKDMQTLPARIFIPHKHPISRRITEAQADYYWMTQTLTGDPTDGYAGCPGIGPKKAEAILGPHIGSLRRMWPAVVDAYRSKGLTEDDAITQARVARILRHTDFDTETREVILWHPTTPSRLPTVDAGTPGSPSAPTTSATAIKQEQVPPVSTKKPSPRTRQRKSRAKTSL